MLHPHCVEQHAEARTHGEHAQIVDQGLQLARREGVGAAIDFMTKNGVEISVIYRVLGDPRFHRPL